MLQCRMKFVVSLADHYVSVIMEAVKQGTRPSIEELPKDVPPPVREMIVACWSQEASDRPSTQGEPCISVQAKLMLR
jgi:hypothetical protein